MCRNGSFPTPPMSDAYHLELSAARCHRSKEFEKEEGFLVELLAIREGPATYDAQVIDTLRTLVFAIEIQGLDRGSEIEAIYRKILVVEEREHGEKDYYHTKRAVCDLAIVLRQSGKYDEAETLYNRMVNIEAEKHGFGSERIDDHLMSMVEMFEDKGDAQKAKKVLRKVVARSERESGKDSVRAVRARQRLAFDSV